MSLRRQIWTAFTVLIAVVTLLTVATSPAHPAARPDTTARLP